MKPKPYKSIHHANRRIRHLLKKWDDWQELVAVALEEFIILQFDWYELIAGSLIAPLNDYYDIQSG